MITAGSLFAGIGGFDIAVERCGGSVRWQVEIDPYCQRVLRKNFPNSLIFGDVRNFVSGEPDVSGYLVDMVMGGFPCQDISIAGTGEGIEGSQSRLWYEFDRVIRVLRPRIAVVENSPEIVRRGLDTVLGCLAESGYDAWWDVLSAQDVGADHERKRLFIVAYANSQNLERWREKDHPEGRSQSSVHAGLEGGARSTWARRDWAIESSLRGMGDGISEELDRVARGDVITPWSAGEWDGVPRAVESVRDRKPRLKALGNAVCPEVATVLLKHVFAADRQIMDFVRSESGDSP